VSHALKIQKENLPEPQAVEKVICTSLFLDTVCCHNILAKKS
jgi:hypothetical protein